MGDHLGPVRTQIRPLGQPGSGQIEDQDWGNSIPKSMSVDKQIKRHKRHIAAEETPMRFA
eukprot:2481147-Rhodomonas_salina.3